MYELNTALLKIHFLGPKHLKALSGAGIFSVGDLLYYFPFRYDDFSARKNICELAINETVTLRGKIEEIKTLRAWKKRFVVTEAFINDQTGLIKAVWFGSPAPLKFLAKGKYVQLSGKTTLDKKNNLILSHPNFEIISQKQFQANSTSNSFSKTASTGILAPIYPESKNISSYWLRKAIQTLLPQVHIPDFIPNDILKSQNLLDRKNALFQIHFPETIKSAEHAQKILAFEKMFLFQLNALQIKSRWEKNLAPEIPFDQKFVKNFLEKLPFSLTDAQKKTAWQIFKDLEKNQPMNRLMEGDVGSGKTIVAALALLMTARQDFQTALLAPTEVLANQHYQTLCPLLEKMGFQTALLTAGKRTLENKNISKKILLEKLSLGQIHCVIGTHALLSEKIKFSKLALIIIDEQHRFGVNQRAFLQQHTLSLDDGMKKMIPHLLTMTATPIPRTLSLALFGDLDLSIIDEYPQGRKKIITRLVLPEQRNEVYQFLKRQISLGHQIFIICPLVEESSKISQVKAVTEEKDRLAEKVFPEFRLALLHGKQKSKEKDEIMNKFKQKEFDILVATSVVEVGVDVPNATIMVIEGAERFGLAQLHQMRGRVGRSQHQSYCFLFTSSENLPSTKRLRILEKTNDGFKIAEEDLALRGAGQFLGTLQSGTPDIAMAGLKNLQMIKSAREQATRILAFDPQLEKFPLLKIEVEKIKKAVHLE